MNDTTPARMKQLRLLADMKKVRELERARVLLEDLVRAAYPSLTGKCLCSRCLGNELRRFDRK